MAAKDLLIKDLSFYDSDVQKIILSIQKHIDDSSFCVGSLSLEVGLSRSLMFRKTKASFGMPPVLLIRAIRLEYGYQLLLKGNLSVAEVAYDCGFTSSQYFATCFKRKYVFLPSCLIKYKR